MNDGNISVYSANSDGTKGDLILEWNDDTILKSHFNTLTVTGGFGGTGNARIRGICNWIVDIDSRSNCDRFRFLAQNFELYF